ncbi:MAG: SIR2 family protein, partial [Acidobacteriota bacterium]
MDAVVAELIDSLERGRTAVFAGAGISFHSGLPLVNGRQERADGTVRYTGLVETVLERLTLLDEEIQTLTGSELPFEAFIETLRAISDVRPIYDIFELGRPNTTHKMLAKWISSGLVKLLCTTNFDRLLEQALLEGGWEESKEYEVIYREEEMASVPWADDHPRLIKIHGGVQDKDAMAITLGQIAQKQLSEARFHIVEHLFETGDHDHVLILGYSSSDVFDLTPQIQSLEGTSKRVLYLEHSTDESRVEPLAARTWKNPFRR